eukprot:764321-Hanusia_phi.AAC.4
MPTANYSSEPGITSSASPRLLGANDGRCSCNVRSMFMGTTLWRMLVDQRFHGTCNLAPPARFRPQGSQGRRGKGGGQWLEEREGRQGRGGDLVEERQVKNQTVKTA